MDLLLDTHALVWWVLDSDRLGPRTRAEIKTTSHVYISSVSVWELSIKVSRGRLQLSRPYEEWIPDVLQHGFEPLPINLYHAYAIRVLPLLHGDPFDRMLVAQAQCEGLTIVTVDPVISAYGVSTLDAST